jgi:hypothetical protein
MVCDYKKAITLAFNMDPAELNRRLQAYYALPGYRFDPKV